MHQFLILIWGFFLLSIQVFNDNLSTPWNLKILYSQNLIETEIKDTCIIEGMEFDIIASGEINGLRAIIKNGRIIIVKSKNVEEEYRVIRYVFSIRSDEKISSVRNYGNLVSYPVINLLKEAASGEIFYFEDIIIVDPEKGILNNAVKPILIRKN
jgi:hypothetical protein